MKGGTPYSSASSSGGAPYSSASSYGSYVNGTGGQQYNRVFDQTGQYAKVQGNGMIGAQGQRAGGKRKRTNGRRSNSRRRQTKRKRGGNIFSTAAVPLALFAMDQAYQPGTLTKMAKNPFGMINENLPRFPKNNYRKSFRSKSF